MAIPAEDTSLTLVPGHRFFVKEIALDPLADAAAQVELGLEAASPFPLAQLFHGFVLSPDRRQALAFAAYRRRFTAEATADWPAAKAVLPDFLAVVVPPPERPLILVQVHAGGINATAWDGRTALPLALVARALNEPSDAQVAETVSDLRRRAGLEEVEVRRLDGPAGAGVDEDGSVVFRIGGEETAGFSAAAIAHADVRDKSFLEERQREDRRSRTWGRLLVAAASLLLLALGLEVVAGGVGLWNARRRQRVNAQAAEVQRIEAAQSVATRIEDLAARPERPLEWLSLVSSVRPRSVHFTRVVSNNDRTLTIDAQTPDAGAVGSYEAALRGRPELAQVETRDLRTREGVTSFVLFVRVEAGGGATAEGQP